jgi:hypothetical protein
MDHPVVRCRHLRGVFPLPALLALLTIACSDLASTRDVRVTILDGAGNPVPGAIFYAEAYDDSGAFAFLIARAGEAGEVPDSAREPLKIPWRRGARIALAAFAPGRRPAVLRRPEGRLATDGAVLVLEPARSAEPGVTSSGALADLHFPFEDDPALAARARGTAGYPELAEAFREALEAGEGGEI